MSFHTSSPRRRGPIRRVVSLWHCGGRLLFSTNARGYGSRPSPGRPWLLQHLEQTRGAHAAADAHGNNGVFRLAAAAFDQRVAGEARTRHAVGVADRNRAAVDIDLVRIDAELVAAIDHLHRKGFVQFPEVDVVDTEAVALEQPRHGEY